MTDLVALLRFQTYVEVAIITFLVCEHVATINLEVMLIWKSRWSLAKTIYLASRYLPYTWLTLSIAEYLLQSSWGPDGSRHCIDLSIPRIWLENIGRSSAEGLHQPINTTNRPLTFPSILFPGSLRYMQQESRSVPSILCVRFIDSYH
ncbi:hypothetical protein P691DRAFT_762002 [Macrolepiota fuliginosa MF-IS2]|uniref:DUF6533 domain-containing protein n=1 Tax=Macrolepiota fuliginosa MF-IS2 TaxID=1400762 RepID=A0A9P6C256_9AGAR|nr:hypothetical protein P691DRAFT_762002 [Macrolepiota fuliginosa MF-IS2]